MPFCVINGSPRGKSGNTQILFEKVLEGVASASNEAVARHYLNTEKGRSAAAEAFSRADLVMLGFPLYTDAMPGIVKAFIESLAPLVGREGNPKMAYLVQSGFPEAHHSRFVENYLEKLTHRLDAPYAGTIVKGGCEGVRMMPEKMNRKLFEGLHEMGVDLALTGKFNEEKLKKLARPERYPRVLAPLLKLMLKLPMAQFYWNSQLKQNDAFEDRFAKPFLD
jgi:NAD(P)H-dependent FMN reductase